MTAHTNTLRLLPWTSPEGKPCFLSAGSDGGVLSRLADSVEAAQTSTGTEVLGGAKAVLADPKVGDRELRFALARVTEVLGDVLRVAESRGARLSVSDECGDSDEGERDDSRRPAEARE
ncbi:hypothetical protein OG211_18325 [Streptomyces niveus]|uniref:hypothetical protein n=1 Tax=Streptomyces niveus TaxID=193462 RepID=UPI00386DEAA6|nr:hypothetical protein OG211_18325 [Streptomyces niveus]